MIYHNLAIPADNDIDYCYITFVVCHLLGTAYNHVFMIVIKGQQTDTADDCSYAAFQNFSCLKQRFVLYCSKYAPDFHNCNAFID